MEIKICLTFILFCSSIVCLVRGAGFTCKSSGIFQDPSDCTAYVICDSSLTANIGSCAPGGHFNPVSLNCDPGPCTAAVTTTTSSSANPNSGFKCQASGIFQDPSDCTAYVICDSTLTADVGSCASVGHFNPASLNCDPGPCPGAVPTTTPSSKNPDPGFICQSAGLFPDPKDCSAFYSCDSQMRAERFHCPLQSYFSLTYMDCEPGNCTATSSTTQIQTTLSPMVTSPVITTMIPTTLVPTTNQPVTTVQTSTVTVAPSTILPSTNQPVTTIQALSSTVTPSTTTNQPVTTVQPSSSTVTPSTTTNQPVTTVQPSSSTVTPSTTKEPSTIPPTTTTPTTTVPTTTISSTLPTSTINPRTCFNTTQTFSDPKDCHKYFRCDSSLNLVSATCGLGFFQHFDASKGTCVFGIC